MSCVRAQKALRGDPTDCIPLFDMPTHRGFLKKLTGIDAFEYTEEAIVSAIKRLDIDMLMCSVPPKTTTTASDPHLYGLDATKWRYKGSTRNDIFFYDPSSDRTDAAGLNESKCVELFTRELDRDMRLAGSIALPIGKCFTTCIHYAAEDLDWEEFLMACVTEEDKIDELLDCFQAASEKIMRAWASVGIEIMLAHDDIAMAKGTVLSPTWLKKHLFYRYEKILDPFKKKGIPVLFMTDGNFSGVAEDLLEIGVNGFFLDSPCMDLEKLVMQCGTDLIYFTGPSPAIMTNGTPSDVRHEVARIAEIARELPRFFFHLPGGYTCNMPVENVTAFYEFCREYGKR